MTFALAVSILQQTGGACGEDSVAYVDASLLPVAKLLCLCGIFGCRIGDFTPTKSTITAAKNFARNASRVKVQDLRVPVYVYSYSSGNYGGYSSDY